jgi:hypothetical protein
MCTVTFVPRDAGYYLAMNRDEQLSRIAGLPPKQQFIDGRSVLFPSEPGGGTWISVNDCGSTLALINWYSIAARVAERPISRGEVVKTANACASGDLVEAQLARLPLDHMNPFRLIGIFPADGEVTEWRWDLKKLERKNRRWKMQQWISSGFDEATAQQLRGKTFEEAQRQRSTGSLDWLRRLHRSHAPHRGAFSTCVHRTDAMTVSYTEISVLPRQARMCYHPTAPCQNSAKGDNSHSLQIALPRRTKVTVSSRRLLTAI